jgi:TonB family protein
VARAPSPAWSLKCFASRICLGISMFPALRFTGWVFMAATLCTYSAVAQSSLEDQLQATLVGGTFPLKSACTLNRLIYDSRGALITDCPAGPWKVYSLFHPAKVKLRHNALEVTGRREVDVVVGAEGKGESSFPEAGSTVLIFQLTAPLSDLASANAVVAVAFDPDKNRTESLGPYGKTLAATGPVPRGVVPRATFTPDPEYSEEARKEKFEGDVVLAVVVNERGRVEIMRVERRLGHGLDEEAIIAASQWKFEPARMDGEAVAAKIAIEVSFHLYHGPPKTHP